MFAKIFIDLLLQCLDHKTFLEAIKLGLTHCATIADRDKLKNN